MGDLNSDGRVTVPDALIGLRISVGLIAVSADQLSAGDLNGDGKLNLSDVIMILQTAVGLRPEVPAPTPPPPTPPQQTTVQLEMGKSYPAGTRVHAPWAGVSFVVSPEWTGALPKDEDGFFMASDKHAGLLMVIALARAPNPVTIGEVAAYLQEPKESEDLVLTPKERAAVADGIARVAYAGRTQQGTLAGFGCGKIGQTGVALAVLAAGPEQDAQYLRAVAEQVLASASFAESQAGQWWNLLAGTWLRLEGGGRWTESTSASDILFSLYADSHFAYKHHWIFVGAAGTAEGIDEKAGTWRVEVNLAGPSLCLEPNDGSDEMVYALGYDGQTVYLDGKPAAAQERL